MGNAEQLNGNGGAAEISQAEYSLEQFQSAVQKFIEDWRAAGREGHDYDSAFDVSNPSYKDIENIRNGNYTIDKFRTAPSSDPTKLSFNFYIA